MISGDFIKRMERKDLRGDDNKRATYCHMQCGSVQLSSVPASSSVSFRIGAVNWHGSTSQRFLWRFSRSSANEFIMNGQHGKRTFF